MPASALDRSRFERLLAAGRDLVAELDLDAVLVRLLDTARELTGARYAAIGVLDDEGRWLARFLTSGVDEATRAAIGDHPRGRGVLGVLVEDPRPLRLARVGEHPRSFGFPAGHPQMSTFLGVPIFIRGKAWGNLYLTEKAEAFDDDDEDTVGVLADWAAIAIQNARLYQTAESQRRRLSQAVEGLEATTAVARAVGSDTDLARVLELIVKRGRALVQARSLVILLARGDELELAAAAGQVDPQAVGAQMPAAGTVAGEVLADGQAERIADVDARFGPLDEGYGVDGAETGLLVPLVYRGRPLGVLAAFDRLTEDDPRFGDREEGLLLAFAASAATAVATARDVEQERLRHSLRSAERERRRWARELHDETLQGLGGLQVLLSGGLRHGGEALDGTLRLAVEQLGTEIANLRALITELRPAALDDLGLTPALEGLADRIRTVEGLDVALELSGVGRLDPDSETAAYRLVQEALTNVAKHAGAERVRIRVTQSPGRGIEVAVIDDGRGFDPNRPSAGFGLMGMRERAELLGGTLEVESTADGTTVLAFLPEDGAAAARNAPRSSGSPAPSGT